MERNWLLLLLMIVVSVLHAAPMKNKNVPRCGVEDSKTGKFSLASGYRWRKQYITWAFHGPAPSHIGHQRTIKIISDAFQRWADIVPLNFSNVCTTCNADIPVYFLWIDVPLGVLAYIKPTGPRPYFDDSHPIMVFDKAENWSIEVEGNADDQISLFLVAAHEIGHLLGLYHDESSDALMYQIHRERRFKKEDIVPPQDKKEIQKIYGSKNSSKIGRTTTITTTTTPTPIPTTTTTPTTTIKSTTATTTTTPSYGNDDHGVSDDNDFPEEPPAPKPEPPYSEDDYDDDYSFPEIPPAPKPGPPYSEDDYDDDDGFPAIPPAPKPEPPYSADDDDDDNDFPEIPQAPKPGPPYSEDDDDDDDGFPKIPPMPTPGSPPDMDNGNNCVEKTVRYANGYKTERRCSSSYSSTSNSHISDNNYN